VLGILYRQRAPRGKGRDPDLYVAGGREGRKSKRPPRGRLGIKKEEYSRPGQRKRRQLATVFGVDQPKQRRRRKDIPQKEGK